MTSQRRAKKAGSPLRVVTATTATRSGLEPTSATPTGRRRTPSLYPLGRRVEQSPPPPCHVCAGTGLGFETKIGAAGGVVISSYGVCQRCTNPLPKRAAQ